MQRWHGGGEAGALILALDWSRTPVGPVERWPMALTTIVTTMLHSRHPMFLWWGPELVQFYNDAYVPSFGVGKHPAAMGQRGRDCWEEIWPIIGPQIDAVMRHATPSWNEDHLVPIFRNGRIEEVFWTYGYSPVFDDDGGVGGTLVICTETTARVIAERRTHLLRALADAISHAEDAASVLELASGTLATCTNDLPFALWYAQPQGASPTVAKAIGVDAATAAAVDRAVRPHLARSELPLHLEIVTAGVPLPGGPWPEPATHVCIVPLHGDRGGAGYLVAGLSPRLTFDDSYRALLLQIADSVTRGYQRVEAWQVRRVVENERNNLLTQAPVATALVVGPDHVFRLANPLYCHLVGRDPGDLLGKPYRDAFPHMTGTPIMEILDRVYRTGQPFVAREFRFPLDRGTGVVEDCYFRFNLEAMRDATGQVYGMMAIAVDITEQVQARRELEAASRRKDEFLAMLAHELRNPLAALSTALDLLGHEETTDTRVLRLRTIAGRQVQHLVRLVDDLLDVARITRGKVELRKQRVDLATVLQGALQAVHAQVEARHQKLTIALGAGPFWIEGDPTRLEQVFNNLLVNASKYTDRGGSIAVRAVLEPAGDATWIDVEIQDTGQGIPPTMVEQVFDLFTQVDGSLDRASGGLGIGLTMVRSLVALHGGTVRACSEGLGHGSTFTVRLPAADAPMRGAASPGTAHARDASVNRRVVVVEDNEDLREMLRDMLTSWGHEVEVASDGVTGSALIKSTRPDIAFIDVGLPGLDGFQVAQSVRSSPGLGRTVLVALTGYGNPEVRARALAAGFDEHVAKPVSSERLGQVLAIRSDSR